MSDVTVRCTVCRAPVDPEVGGSRCSLHRPLDLTGGVAPWESTEERGTLKGQRAPRPRIGRPPLVSDQAREEIVRRYLAGESSYAIGASERISSALVRHYVRSAGHAMRPPSGRPALDPTDPTTLRWIALRDEGHSLRALERETGVPRGTIAERVRVARERLAQRDCADG